jgi:hypothetical protein
VIIVECDFGDDDFYPNLREDNVEFIDEFFHEPDVVGGAEHDNGVTTIVIHNRHQRAELVCASAHEVEVRIICSAGRNNLRLRGLRRCTGDIRLSRLRTRLAGTYGACILSLNCRRLPGDDLAEDSHDIGRLRVFEIKNFVAGIRVRLLIELVDEFAEEVPLPRIGDDDDLLRAVIGVVRGRGTQLGLQCAPQNRAELVHELARLHISHCEEFRFHSSHERLVDLLEQCFDPLKITDAVGDENRVGIRQRNRAAIEGIQDSRK